ncbi:MAG TPA: dTMP kinase, partial [Vicinamibacterales bacterium]
MKADSGLLIAFEGLDQSGKQTQAELLRDRLTAAGRPVRLLSFPDYGTVIGAEIGRALRGERQYTADVMQLLYVANRYEWKGEIVRAREAGTIVLSDRYLASSIAYGEAQGLDGGWLREIQKYLPQPAITFLL